MPSLNPANVHHALLVSVTTGNSLPDAPPLPLSFLSLGICSGRPCLPVPPITVMANEARRYLGGYLPSVNEEGKPNCLSGVKRENAETLNEALRRGTSTAAGTRRCKESHKESQN
ncbi:hypothetical protein E2C01_071916 [Portunus trituberculatus]|uniref:Uncharacterized protein n=1 Tax=Portunus trituberculatus TaxID=210409 RepID=A0A5B7I169_PORTR|nr:hypothetical protein [Portunus trituberculatus]